MPFTPLFTASQPSGYPNIVTLNDVSTGSDGAITKRWAFLQKSDGTYLVTDGVVTDYNLWPLAQTSIDLDLLDKDYAILLTIQWLDNSDTVLYSSTAIYGFTQYNEVFDYTLTQIMAGNPLLLNDNGFYAKKQELRVDIDSGDKAVYWNDIFNAQLAYDLATSIRLNKTSLFGLLT